MSQSTTARDRDAGGHPTDHEVGDGGGRWDTYDAGDEDPDTWDDRPPGELDDQGKLVLARRLILEGMVHFVD